MASPRLVAHCDLDAFYASAELLRRPELRGRPLVVGGQADERGVVSAASYEARAFGVHSAMPLRTAARLCPDAVFVPVDFDWYAPLSRQVFEIYHSIAPVVEPVALDEAYLDLTGTHRLHGPPPAVGHLIRDRVKREVGLDVSIGLATSKLVAKVASDAEKPRGLVYVSPGAEAAFLAPRPLRALPGLGAKTEETLRPLRLRTLGDLAALRLEHVPTSQRPMLARLQAQARGEDLNPVTAPQRQKSLSREETFGRDTADRDQLRGTIRRLTLGVAEGLRRAGLKASVVELKLRYTPFRTVLRSRTLPAPSNADRPLELAVLELFERHFEGGTVRLVGAGGSGLIQAEAQADLFEGAGSEAENWAHLDRLLDELRARFGPDAIWMGAAGRGHERAARDWTREDLERASTTRKDAGAP